MNNLRLATTFFTIILSFSICYCVNQACETNIRPAKNFDINVLNNTKWYLIASTYTEKISRSCVSVSFFKKDQQSTEIKITENSKNEMNLRKEVSAIRKLDYNNEGIFEPDPSYFNVYDTFNRVSTQLLPGMGISLYLDDILYIEYVHYDVVHTWYRECYKRVFIYHKTSLPHVFESIFPIIKRELNAVGVSLDTIEVKPFDRSCILL